MTYIKAVLLRTFWIALSLVLVSSGVLRAEEEGPSARDQCLTDPVCRTHYAHARALFKDQQYEEALSEYLQAYQTRSSPWLLINIGRTYYRLGRPREALEYFQRYQQAAVTADLEIQKRLTRYISDAMELMTQAAPPTVAPPIAPPASEPAASAAPELPQEPAVPPESASIGAPGSPPGSPPPAPTPAVLAVSTAVSPRPAAPPQPLYKRPWFWTVVGVVIAGGVTGAVVGTLTGSSGSMVQIPPQAMHLMPTF